MWTIPALLGYQRHAQFNFAETNHPNRMKKSLSTLILTVVAAAAIPAFAAEDACSKIASEVTASVSAAPTDVLKIVSEQVQASSSCACEIVRAAIVASKADKDLVGDIVATAVTAAPNSATTIAECAVAASPEASDNIKAALKRAMSDGKNPAGKNPGKQIVEAQEEDPDFGLSPVSIGGVYLVYPGSGGSSVPNAGKLVRKNGRLYVVRPDGSLVPVPPTTGGGGGGRPNRPPGVIVINPTSP